MQVETGSEGHARLVLMSVKFHSQITNIAGD